MKIKYLILLSVTGSVIALDQMTKHLILTKFSLGETLPLISGFFSLTYVRNAGAAFGLLSTLSPELKIPFFILVPIGALSVVAYLFKKLEDYELPLALSLSMVIGGALGNLIDRIAYRYVVDFLDFHWGATGPRFPSFNFADVSITLGVCILVWELIRKEKNASHTS